MKLYLANFCDLLFVSNQWTLQSTEFRRVALISFNQNNFDCLILQSFKYLKRIYENYQNNRKIIRIIIIEQSGLNFNFLKATLSDISLNYFKEELIFPLS